MSFDELLIIMEISERNIELFDVLYKILDDDILYFFFGGKVEYLVKLILNS